MEHNPKRRWSLFHSAGLGALVGIGVGKVHTLLHTFGSVPSDEDPFIHVVLDYVGFISAAVLVLVIVAAIRNRLM